MHSAKIAVLKKELTMMKEKVKEDNIAATLSNSSKNIKTPNSELISVARQVTTIISRKKKSK